MFYLKHLDLKASVAHQFMRLKSDLLHFGCMWIDPIQRLRRLFEPFEPFDLGRNRFISPLFR